MKPQTLNDIFFAIVERRQDRVMLVREGSEWVPVSSQEFYRDVARVARAFNQWGLVKGDRLAILSENRLEWAVTDFASLMLGLAVVPIYSTLTAQQTAYILRDSGARVVVVSTEKQLEKVLSIKDQTAIEKIVLMDTAETPDAVPHAALDAQRPSWTRPGTGRPCARHHSRRSGIHHLYVGHDRHIEGRATDARQFDLKCAEFAARF